MTAQDLDKIICSARTEAQITDAWNALDTWLGEHPDEQWALDYGSYLSRLEDSVRTNREHNHPLVKA